MHAASNIYQALEFRQPLKMTVVRGTEHLQIKVILEGGSDSVCFLVMWNSMNLLCSVPETSFIKIIGM